MQIKYINENNKSIELNTKPSFLRLYYVEGKDGLSNQISSSKITFTDGINVFNTTINERSLAIIGKIISKDKEQVANIKRNLIETFNVKSNGLLIYKDTEESKEYCIDCIVTNGPKFTVNGYGVIDFIVELVAPYPFWRDKKEAKVEIAQIKGSFHFPLNIPTIMGYKQPSLIVNCNNTGDVEVGMRIEFIAKKELKNPSLFDVNTRKFIKINKNMARGEKITINTNIGKKYITSNLNGVETKILHLLDFESDFLQLKKGDNLFRYNADEGIDFLTCNIYYSPKYLGV